MNDLAARISPHMSGILMHPGDAETEPFPIAPLPIFQNQAMMPPGLAKQEALEAGLPSPDFARIYCEAWLHLVETVGDVTLVDNTELADLKAAAAVRESKRNQMVEFHTPCGKKLRAMARGFDTASVEVPCEMVNHNCGVK